MRGPIWAACSLELPLCPAPCLTFCHYCSVLGRMVLEVLLKHASSCFLNEQGVVRLDMTPGGQRRGWGMEFTVMREVISRGTHCAFIR